MTALALMFWDFALLAFVCFPILTGGVWYRGNGMILELSEPLAPALAVFALGVLLKVQFKIPIETSRVSRFFINLWDKWKQSLSQNTFWTLAITFLSIGSFWAFAAIHLYLRFQAGGDLAIPLNAIWNLSHGYGYVAAMKEGRNFLLDHQDPLFILVAPIFKLFPFAETLLMIQAFVLASGGIAAFLLASRYFPKQEKENYHWFVCFIPLSYWMSRLVRKPNLFDFHQGVFLLPLFLFGLAGIFGNKKSSKIWGIVCFLLALLAKETAGPIAIGIAVAILFGAGPLKNKFTTAFALILIPLGIFVLYSATTLLPKFLGGSYGYTGLYPQFGKGITSVLLAPFLQTELFFSTLFAANRRIYFFLTLAPFALLPLFAPSAFLAALPAYLMLFLTEGSARVNLYAHYTVEPAVGLFWAYIVGVKNICRGERTRNHLVLKIILLVCTLAYSGRSEWVSIREATDSPHKKWIREVLLPSLNPEVSVEAPGKLVSHIANRHWANALSEYKGENGKAMDCVILDEETAGEYIEVPSRDRFLQNYQKLGYQLIYQCQNLKLFQHQNVPQSCLKQSPTCWQ